MLEDDDEWDGCAFDGFLYAVLVAVMVAALAWVAWGMWNGYAHG